MTHYVSSGTLNPTHSLTIWELQTFKKQSGFLYNYHVVAAVLNNRYDVITLIGLYDLDEIY